MIILYIFHYFQVRAHSGTMAQIVKKCPNVTAQIHFQSITLVIAIVREIGMENNAIVLRQKMTHASGQERSVGEMPASVETDTPEQEWAVEV
jgi:hypothetical protein